MCTLIIPLHAGVTFVVDQAAYNVDESAGSVTVCACLELGELTRPVNLNVNTQDGTAQG